MNTKICTRCGTEYPATTDYFSKKAGRKNGLDWWCKKCACEYAKQWYEKNREKALARARKWKKEHKEDIKQYKKEYELANLEKHKKQNSLRGIRWAKRHPEKVRKRTANYRARKKHVASTFTLEQWRQCKIYFDHSCAYCGEKIKRLEQDHFVALSNGGGYVASNIIPACKSCNSSKCDSDFFEWYPKQPFYSKDRETRILEYLNSFKNDSGMGKQSA